MTGSPLSLPSPCSLFSQVSLLIWSKVDTSQSASELLTGSDAYLAHGNSVRLNDLNNGQCLPCIAGATWIQRRCQAEFARSNQIPNCTNRTTLARVMKTQERLVTGQWSAQYLSRFKRLSPRGQLGINLVTYLGWGCPLWQQPVSRLDNLKLCFWAQTGHCIYPAKVRKVYVHS